MRNACEMPAAVAETATRPEDAKEARAQPQVQPQKNRAGCSSVTRLNPDLAAKYHNFSFFCRASIAASNSTKTKRRIDFEAKQNALGLV